MPNDDIIQDRIDEYWGDVDAASFDNVMEVFERYLGLDPLETLRKIDALTDDEFNRIIDKKLDVPFAPIVYLLYSTQSNPPKAVSAMIEAYRLQRALS